jgi:hypothetical protein
VIIKVREKDAQRALEKYLGSIGLNVQINLTLPVGKVDIFATEIIGNKENSYLIEIKLESQIKRAIGQIQSYRKYVPATEYHIVTFNSQLGKEMNRVTKDEYHKVCEQEDIKLFRIEDTNALPFLRKELGL